MQFSNFEHYIDQLVWNLLVSYFDHFFFSNFVFNLLNRETNDFIFLFVI